jgi:dsRNA-specific ribonuclease
MSRRAHDQNSRNGRSRRSGQQYAHGDGHNTRYGHDEHVTIGQQSAPDQNHYRMQLNNFLQHRYRSTQNLRLESSSSGPGHALWWTVIVYFRDCEYGRGEGATKAIATENACQIALQALMHPGSSY